MQVQYGRSLGILAIVFGLLLLCVQLLLWSRIYRPSSPVRTSEVLAEEPHDPAPSTLPAWLGSMFVLSGIVVFSSNLERPQDAPVQPHPKA